MGRGDQFQSITTPAGKKYFMWTEWKEQDGFCVSLFSGIKAWRGKISNAELTALSEHTGLEYKEFMDLTRKAYSSGGGGSREEFVYDVVVEEDKAKLSWKKKLSDKAQYHLGTVTLDKLDGGEMVLDSLFEQFGQWFASLSNRVVHLEEENSRLSEEQKRATQRLNEAIQAKQDVEEQFLDAFQSVLNAKKRKIGELMEELDDTRKRLDSGKSREEMEPETSGVSSKRTKNTAYGADSDGGGNTDEEKEHLEETRREKGSKTQNMDDIELILTHNDDRTGQAAQGGNKKEAGDEEELFVPKRRGQRRGRRDQMEKTESTHGVATRTRQRSAMAESDTVEGSADGNSQKQGRNSSSSTMNLISKLA